jgi:membrane protein DedA with SNARE-associated domain
VGFLTSFLHATTLQIVLALLAGGIGLPVPEDLVLLVAGWRVSHGDVSFARLAPLALIAIVVSDVALYGFGRLACTHPRIARWLERPSTARWCVGYRRHGMKLVLLARVAMGMRAPFFLAAGMARMPVGRFVIVDALGAAVMTCLWMSIGAWLGPRLGALAPHLHAIATGAAILVVVLLLWKARRRFSRDATNAPERSSPTMARRREKASARA